MVPISMVLMALHFWKGLQLLDERKRNEKRPQIWKEGQVNPQGFYLGPNT